MCLCFYAIIIDLIIRDFKPFGKGIEFHDVSALSNHLEDHCCSNLLAFHALTGLDFTYPFFRRGTTQGYIMMMNLKHSKRRIASLHLLDFFYLSIGTTCTERLQKVKFTGWNFVYKLNAYLLLLKPF